MDKDLSFDTVDKTSEYLGLPKPDEKTRTEGAAIMGKLDPVLQQGYINGLYDVYMTIGRRHLNPNDLKEAAKLAFVYKHDWMYVLTHMKEIEKSPDGQAFLKAWNFF